jgi:uncharacterized protein
MSNNLKLVLSAVVLFLSFFVIEGAVQLPDLKMMVNDNAGVLNSNQERELESLLRSLESSTSAELAILIVTNLSGMSLEEYSMRVAEKWQLGKQDRDNGILLLVSINDRKVRLEVGYGLEDIVTDAKSSYIINQLIVPEFRKGDYYSGIRAGLQAAAGLVNNSYEITAEELEEYQRSEERSRKSGGMPLGLMIFILFLLFSGRRGKGGILPWLLLGSMMGGRGGSGRSGGFGSGGFGGFSGGGGSFGGGGASGGW